MIVWGGSDCGVYSNTGGRYNPATDTWKPTSTGANVPMARWSHGGLDGYGDDRLGRHFFDLQRVNWYLNTGGRYDPATDSWAATSTGANVPRRAITTRRSGRGRR